MLTELQVKQIEYLSVLKRVINGAHKEYFKGKWRNDYEDNIKILKNAFVKLTTPR
jgi:hypothetical protein